MDMKFTIFLFVMITNSLSKVLLTSGVPKSRNNHRRHTKLSLKEDKGVHIGQFANVLYRGTWNSNKPGQNNFIHANTGFMTVAFAHTYDPSKLSFEFIINEGFYFEDRYMAALFELAIDNDSQTFINGRTEKTEIYKVQHIFADQGENSCSLVIEMGLYDADGTPQAITTSNIFNLIIKGTIKSDNCDINADFSVSALQIQIFGIVLFIIVQIAAVILGFYPFCEALTTGEFSEINNLSDTTFLMNIAIDIIMLSMNLTFSMRVIPEYFEFLALLTMFMFMSVVFKIRIYVNEFEKSIENLNTTVGELSRIKFNFFMKFILVFISAVAVSDFLLINYRWFLVIGLYPLFQIMYNNQNNLRSQCFKLHLHGAIIISQFIFPISIRCFHLRFFQLRQDYNFGFGLVTILITQLMIMYLQKLLGPTFYLPRILISGYYEYMRKLNDLEDLENHNCPICFIPLNELPDSETKAAKTLLPYRFMETPCKHKYHENCLKAWMEQKLVCPCCRATIPPY